MTVYADIVFLWNSVSALLLLCSVRIFFSQGGKWYRLIISSLLGGIFGVFNTVFSLWQPLRFAMLFVMTLVAWGRKGILFNLFRVMFLEGVTVIAIMVLSGLSGINIMVTGTGIILVADDLITAFFALISYPLIVIIKRLRQRYNRLITCSFYINGKELKLRLLYDSGNLLMHKSVPVAVAEWRKIPGITSYEDALLTASERMMYSTVASGGIMPLIKPEKTVIRGRETDCYIGLTDRQFKGYAGIIGDIDRGGK